MSDDKVDRRGFLKQTAVAGMGVAVVPKVLPRASRPRPGLVASAGRQRSLTVLEAAIAPGVDPEGPSNVAIGAEEVIDNTYDTLVSFRRSLSSGVNGPIFTPPLAPSLATSWEKRGSDWILHLRKGVISAVGNELTADDVIWTAERAKSVSDACPCAWFLFNVGGVMGNEVFDKGVKAGSPERRLNGDVVKLDRYTVRFRQSKYSTLFPMVETAFSAVVYDHKEVEKHTSKADPWAHTWLNTGGTAGFGPYQIGSWNKGVSMALEANPHYYRGAPSFTTVNIQQVPEDSDRIAAIETGAADIVTNLTPKEYSVLQQSGKANVFNWVGTLFIWLGLNYDYEPWGGGGNPTKARLLRQAVASAIPYDSIIKKDFFGQARQWNSMVTSGFVDQKSYPGMYTYDPDKAKSLLARAGHPNGKGLSGPGLTLIYTSERQSTLEPLAIDIQTALARVGISIQLSPIPEAEFTPRQLVKYNLPFFIDDLDPVLVPDAGYTLQLFFLKAAQGGLQDMVNYDSATVNRLYAMAKTAHSAQRRRLMGEAQDVLMRDLPMIPLVERALQVGVRKGLTDWSPGADLTTQYFTLRDA